LPKHLRSVATVPLSIGRRCSGVFLVQSRETRTVTREALATASLVASLTAAMLARGEGGETGPQIAGGTDRSAPISVASDRANGRRRILVVEDDLATSTALVDLLEGEGYSVQCAADGQEGAMRALSTRPDVVLLDVGLPVMDGFDVAARLRAPPDGSDVPIIFLSGSADLASRIRAIKLESIDFVPKPFRMAELLARIERAVATSDARQALQLHADHDPLTGLANLRLFRARMANEHARFSRYGNPLSLAMIDVDKLKGINDVHGHLAGSEALRSIATVLQRQARETDLAARYGGDEFVVLLSHTTLDEAAAFAERVRAEVALHRPGVVDVTVSIGIASLSVPGNPESDEHLLKRADAAAYLAKRQGGNRVCLDREIAPASAAPPVVRS
jgi:diguanylate cyclase (GGDEF)-like protein